MSENPETHNRPPKVRTVYDKALETIERLANFPKLADPESLRGLGQLLDIGVRKGYVSADTLASATLRLQILEVLHGPDETELLID